MLNVMISTPYKTYFSGDR